MKLATRVAVFALLAAGLGLMYEGERWMLERPSTAADAALIATCALEAVADMPVAAGAGELIR
jgi:hypothetical protein